MCTVVVVATRATFDEAKIKFTNMVVGVERGVPLKAGGELCLHFDSVFSTSSRKGYRMRRNEKAGKGGCDNELIKDAECGKSFSARRFRIRFPFSSVSNPFGRAIQFRSTLNYPISCPLRVVVISGRWCRSWWHAAEWRIVKQKSIVLHAPSFDPLLAYC